MDRRANSGSARDGHQKGGSSCLGFVRSNSLLSSVFVALRVVRDPSTPQSAHAVRFLPIITSHKYSFISAFVVYDDGTNADHGDFRIPRRRRYICRQCGT